MRTLLICEKRIRRFNARLQKKKELPSQLLQVEVKSLKISIYVKTSVKYSSLFVIADFTELKLCIIYIKSLVMCLFKRRKKTSPFSLQRFTLEIIYLIIVVVLKCCLCTSYNQVKFLILIREGG